MASLVLYDTEFTAWPGSVQRNWSGEGEAREIICLCAQRLSLPDLSTVSHFRAYVRPRNNPTLSPYITRLTGISQRDVDAADDFPRVWARFLEWAQGSATLYSYSGDARDDGADREIVLENMAIHAMTPVSNDLLARMRNIAVLFSRAGIPTDRYSSGTLCEAFPGSCGVPRPHDCAWDVESLARSLRALRNKLGNGQ